jgi:lysophospholipase L1-like esterase
MSNRNYKGQTFLILALILSCSVLLNAQTARKAEEVIPRDGLPHVSAKLRAGKQVSIAYLGGSITAANGWRDLSFNWIAQQYPKARLNQINATISGTGSMLGVFRMDKDVMQAHPDLIFIEFAVNDHGLPPASIIRSMEGIVRKARTEDPDIDICFVYTLNLADLPKLQAGLDSDSSAAMEQVADHYNIPSINFGVSVASLVTEGKLIFKGPLSPAGSPASSPGQTTPAFSGDGTHPYTQTGHQLYLAAFARSAPALLAARSTQTLALAPPLDPLNLSHATILPLDTVILHGDWKPAHLVDDSEQMGASSFPPALASSHPHDSITFSFDGDIFGVYGVKGGDAAQFTVVIDGQKPITAALFDSLSTAGRYRIWPWFSPFLPPGKHTVVITNDGPASDKLAILRRDKPDVADSPDYSKSMLYVGGILINGSRVK